MTRYQVNRQERTNFFSGAKRSFTGDSRGPHTHRDSPRSSRLTRTVPRLSADLSVADIQTHQLLPGKTCRRCLPHAIATSLARPAASASQSYSRYGWPQYGAIALGKNLTNHFHSDIILATQQFDILDVQQSERRDKVRFEICEVPQLNPTPRPDGDSFVLSNNRLREPRDIENSLSSNLIHELGLDCINCWQNSGASRLSPLIGESRIL